MDSEKRTLVALWGVAAPFAFDIRGGTDDIATPLALQLVILAIALSVSAWYLAKAKVPLPFVAKFTLGCFAAWLTWAVLVGLAAGQDTVRVATAAVPAILFMLATQVAHTAFRTCRSEVLSTHLLFIAVIYFVARAIFVARLGIPLVQVRFFILPANTIFLTALGMAFMFAGWTLFGALIVFADIAFIIISVTRTQLVIAASLFAATVLMRPRMMGVPRVVKHLAIVGAAVGCLALFGGLSDNVFINSWIDRLFWSERTGIDVTEATRLAEVQGMLDALLHSVSEAMIGGGIAKLTEFSGEYASFVVSILGQDAFDFANFGFGHNQYVSLLFNGGIIFGSLAVVASAVLAWSALRTVRCSVQGAASDPAHFVKLWGALAVLGFTIFGFSAGTFGDRGLSLWYGIAAGMTFVRRAEVAPAAKAWRPREVPLRVAGAPARLSAPLKATSMPTANNGG